ncbi:MAG: HipA domain-containing protein [Archangium sp.]|nr:HipA domain-containing protein [Archangium sp.]
MAADPRSAELLNVFHNYEHVGVLRRLARGCEFSWTPEYFAAHRANPEGLARHLPFASATLPHPQDNLPPYFAGLLPEGLRLRAVLARTKTSEDDLFTLLVAVGSNCVGDLFPMLPGATHPLEEREHKEPLDRVRFSELFAAVLEHDSAPIAGVQEKLSPSMISFPFATTGKQWILKLNPPERERLVENEHFFMNMAGECGLNVPRTHLVHDKSGAPGLLVERFDRIRKNGRWFGVRQEDGCQLVDRFPADKYRIKTSDLFEALEICVAPIASRAAFLEQLAFSYLIGNGDLHAKNVSVTAANGLLQLSPAYDVLCTRPYRDQSLALEIEGRKDNLKRRDLLALGERYGVRTTATEDRLDRLLEAAQPWAARFGELGFDKRLTKQIKDQFDKRFRELSPVR